MLPPNMVDWSRNNAGIVCYHSAIESIEQREVPVTWALLRYREGKPAGTAASEYKSSEAEETETQLLLEAWELIIERGESTDIVLQMRQERWLRSMESRFQ